MLERISDGVRQEDRMSALEELRDVVTDNRAAQLAVGSMGEENWRGGGYNYLEYTRHNNL